MITFGPYACIAQSSKFTEIQDILYMGEMQYGNSYATLTTSGQKFTGLFGFHLDREKNTIIIDVLEISDDKDNKTLFHLTTKLSDISPIINNNKLSGIEMLINGIKYRLFKANDDYGVELRIGEKGEMSYLCLPNDAIVRFYSKNGTKISGWRNVIVAEPDGYREKVYTANDKFNDWMNYLKSLIGR